MADKENPGKRSLKIAVRDFGPIGEAEIELRPLTVFVGPSNTGKSYMAILIYALHKFLNSSFHTFSLAETEKFFSDRKIHYRDLFAKGPEKMLSGFVPDDILDLFKEQFERRKIFLFHELARCFGQENMSVFQRWGSESDRHIEIISKFEDNLSACNFKLSIIPSKEEMNIEQKGEVGFWKGETDQIPKSLYDNFITEKRYKNDEKMIFFDLFAKVFINLRHQIFGELTLPAHYLPASRTGIIHTRNVIVSALIKNTTISGDRFTSKFPLLSGVLADFIEQLLDPGAFQNISSKDRIDDRHAKQIEDKILKGAIHKREMELSGSTYFTYQPKGWGIELPMMHVSSMVSELAPIVLYLRYIIAKNNVLIIEEPEAHLHPAMQVEFIRQLAQLIHAGIRVIVTTHSEWILEELANIVHRSEIPSNGDEKASLNKKDVGVWLFETGKSHQGSKVKEITLGKSGLYPSKFDDVAMALHNDWAGIESKKGKT